MATIKLEILLDSNEQNDITAFANLMNAFSGTPSVQYLSSGKYETFSKAAVEAGVRAETNTEAVVVTTEISKEEEYQNGYEYSEAEMLKLPNTDLKDYATGLGIDWAKAEGKNTNRKLADLVLTFRNGETPASEAAREEAPTEETEETNPSSEAITYDMLKLALSKKVEEHREAIVEKLGELGATKMPNLAEENWEEMYNFMEAL